MSNRRRGVFNADRQDVPDLNWDLPAPPAPKVQAQRAQPTRAKPIDSGVTETSDRALSPKAAAGALKKAGAGQAGTGTITQVPVRVPTQLYEAVQEYLLGTRERPSYGQLVTWACQDHPDRVVANLLTSAGPSSARTPRGSRRASPTTPMVLRLLEEELTTLLETQDKATEKAGVSVTRTAVVVAALQTVIGQERDLN